MDRLMRAAVDWRSSSTGLGGGGRARGSRKPAKEVVV